MITFFLAVDQYLKALFNLEFRIINKMIIDRIINMLTIIYICTIFYDGDSGNVSIETIPIYIYIYV